MPSSFDTRMCIVDLVLPSPPAPGRQGFTEAPPVRVTLLHNPTSGDASASAEELEGILADAGYQVRYQALPGEWKTNLEDPGDLVVAAGGDGTVAEALMTLAGRDVPVAILPFGTANNIAKSLRIVGETAQIVAGWRERNPEPLDLGLAANAGAAASAASFVESAGGGAFAELIRRGKRHVEVAGSLVGRETDRALYLLGTILAETEPAAWGVELDGVDASGDYVAVEALNIRFGGPNIPLAPDADPGDGLLDVVLLDDGGRARLDRYLRERLEHGSARLGGLTVRRARRVRLSPPAGVPFHLDDRLSFDEGETDRSIELAIRPAAVAIVRPPRD